MVRLSIDPDGDIAPFEQVRTQIARQVASGELEPGERLPTVRRLAAELGLAANTVARAFRELEADGVIMTMGRRGSFVSSRAADDGTGTPDVDRAATTLAQVARTRGLSLPEATRLLERAWSSDSPR